MLAGALVGDWTQHDGFRFAGLLAEHIRGERLLRQRRVLAGRRLGRFHDILRGAGLRGAGFVGW